MHDDDPDLIIPTPIDLPASSRTKVTRRVTVGVVSLGLAVVAVTAATTTAVVAWHRADEATAALNVACEQVRQDFWLTALPLDLSARGGSHQAATTLGAPTPPSEQPTRATAQRLIDGSTPAQRAAWTRCAVVDAGARFGASQ